MNLRERMRYELAQFFSLNNQPDMSGDPTRRLSPLQKQNLDRCIDAAILAMFDHLAANVSEGMMRAGCENGWRKFAKPEDSFRAMLAQASREYEETSK